MVEIMNYKVYDLVESVVSCRNAMRVDFSVGGYSEASFKAALPRAVKLARLGGGSGHSNFRKGIRVSFDIRYENYFSCELQRYGFVDIVCSSSKMHRLCRMDMDKCFNKYVSVEMRELMRGYVEKYNREPSYENFMVMLSNCPCGIELVMRCSTNYEQLSTIYKQRRGHRLVEDWGVFCDWIESLPYSHELIICDKDLQD